MKKMRSFLAMALCLLMLVSMFGCNKSTDTTSEPEEDNSSVQSIEDEVTTPDTEESSTPSKLLPTDDDEGDVESDKNAFAGIEKYKGKTLRFATWVDHTSGEAANAIATFCKKYEIKYERVNVGQYEYITKISGLVASGQSPDIIVENGNFPGLFPFAQRLDKIASINLNDGFWDKGKTELCSIDGVPYFVNSQNGPWNDLGLVAYNKKLFEDNGFKTPDDFVNENNWNLDTFMECANRISKLGSGYTGTVMVPGFMTAMFGTQLVKYENGKFTNNTTNEAVTNAFRWYMNGVDSKVICPTMTMTELNAFSDGKTGMVVYTDFLLKTSGPIRGIDKDILAAVPLPKVNKGDAKYPTFTGIRAYGVCKGARNPELAGYFLRHFLDKKYYDSSDVYLNSKSSKLVKKLSSITSAPTIMYSEGVLNIIDGLNTDAKYYATVTDSTAAQVAVNLKSVSGSVEACVKKANDILNDKKNNK